MLMKAGFVILWLMVLNSNQTFSAESHYRLKEFFETQKKTQQFRCEKNYH